jgi:hypothetical protein
MSKRIGLLIIVLIMLLIIVSYQYVTLNSQYNRILNEHCELNSLYVENQNNYNRYNQLQHAYNQSQYMYNQLLGDYSRTQIIYHSPATNNSIIIWTIPQTISPTHYIVWELLDTFDNHIRINTTQTVQFMVLSLVDYVNFTSGKLYVAAYNSTGTSFSRDIRFTQDCAGYVLVIVNLQASTTVVYPNVTATYAPTRFLTGVCSLP